jgi:alkylresorcinol/alkylpyrone synthase
VFLTGIGTAVPERRYTQAECREAFERTGQYGALPPRARALARKVFDGTNGIEARHLSLDSIEEAFDIRPDVLHARFARHAPELARAACVRALADAGLEPGDVDGIVASTCTGYLCPGLSSYLAESLGIRPEASLVDLVGQGCVAALPNLRCGEAMVRSGRVRRVLSVCVEVCSAAVYVDDDPGVLISLCLFGDGAGAAVLEGEQRPGRTSLRWGECGAVHRPEHRELLRFGHRGGMLRNQLAPEVPVVAGDAARCVLEQTLARAGIGRDAVTSWIFHTGGRDVLNALRDALDLPDHELRHSRSVLRDLGNVSSACVYFVLERALREGMPAGWCWMAAFGAGFSSQGALLDVRPA